MSTGGCLVHFDDFPAGELCPEPGDAAPDAASDPPAPDYVRRRRCQLDAGIPDAEEFWLDAEMGVP